MQWEYAVESWVFTDARFDPWPGKDAWIELVEAANAGRTDRVPKERPKGPEADELRRAYMRWRQEAEQGWLNEMGKAQFELVALYREEDWARHIAIAWRPEFPSVTVQAYFKRELQEESVPKPPIGFRPPEGPGL